jgi:hypothetical protein
MEQVKIKEVRSEVLVFLDYNHPTDLDALREAARVIQREVLRLEAKQQGKLR